MTGSSLPVDAALRWRARAGRTRGSREVFPARLAPSFFLTSNCRARIDECDRCAAHLEGSVTQASPGSNARNWKVGQAQGRPRSKATSRLTRVDSKRGDPEHRVAPFLFYPAPPARFVAPERNLRDAPAIAPW